MTHSTAIVFSFFILKSDDLRSLYFAEELCMDSATLDEGQTYMGLSLSVQKQNLVKNHFLTRSGLEKVDIDDISFFYTKLLAACVDNSVLHKRKEDLLRFQDIVQKIREIVKLEDSMSAAPVKRGIAETVETF
jgi:hypothetical protein